jgi:hypothetical protein
MKIKLQIMRLGSMLMLLVFLAAIMPKELMHDALLHHHDDVHPIYKKGELVYSPKHHHCSFLVFEFTPFVAQQFIVFQAHKPIVYIAAPAIVYQDFELNRSIATSLRGPPVQYT